MDFKRTKIQLFMDGLLLLLVLVHARLRDMETIDRCTP